MPKVRTEHHAVVQSQSFLMDFEGDDDVEDDRVPSHVAGNRPHYLAQLQKIQMAKKDGNERV